MGSPLPCPLPRIRPITQPWFPDLGSNLSHPHWERGVSSSTGPPGKSPLSFVTAPLPQIFGSATTNRWATVAALCPCPEWLTDQAGRRTVGQVSAEEGGVAEIGVCAIGQASIHSFIHSPSTYCVQGSVLAGGYLFHHGPLDTEVPAKPVNYKVWLHPLLLRAASVPRSIVSGFCAPSAPSVGFTQASLPSLIMLQGAWASCLKPVCLELRAGAEPWAQNLWITWYSRSTMRLGTKAVPV